MNRRQFLAGAGAVTAWGGLAWYASRGSARGGASILNVSYDATRELYRNINLRFLAEHGATVRPSHGGSGKQALAVREGLPADVVSLAVWPDTNELQKTGLIDKGWEERFPNHSLPYTSTIVFVVRKGNPKQIYDWPDLVKPDGLRVVASNPKTGGAAKLAVLAAWGAAKETSGSETKADDYVMKLFNPMRIPILESSSRTATQSFARKKMGDVHITWESEAILELRELQDEVEIVRPAISVLAEPHVAVVDANARHHGTEQLAAAYVRFLYTLESQQIIAGFGFRPQNEIVRQETAIGFGSLKMLAVRDILPGGWPEAQERFFNDGGLFDRAYL
ncbi:sulfate ABC transporter substrate-binding protein [soil metagenome]